MQFCASIIVPMIKDIFDEKSIFSSGTNEETLKVVHALSFERVLLLLFFSFTFRRWRRRQLAHRASTIARTCPSVLLFNKLSCIVRNMLKRKLKMGTSSWGTGWEEWDEVRCENQWDHRDTSGSSRIARSFSPQVLYKQTITNSTNEALQYRGSISRTYVVQNFRLSKTDLPLVPLYIHMYVLRQLQCIKIRASTDNCSIRSLAPVCILQTFPVTLAQTALEMTGLRENKCD